MVSSLRDELIQLANQYGADEQYSRAGGGNASFKEDGVLWIKPSGVPMATLAGDDLVPLHIDVLLDALASDEPVDGDPVQVAAKAARVGEDNGRRPSVEILFHALIEDPLVLHLHPMAANAVTCNVDGASLAAQLFGDEAVWVDYVDPGVPLAREIAAARQRHSKRTGTPAPAITLLGNHGIIVSGTTRDEVSERVEWLSSRVHEALDAAPARPEATSSGVEIGDWAERLREALGRAAVAADASPATVALAATDAPTVAEGPLIPDHIVYAGSFPLVVEAEASEDTLSAALQAYEAEHGRAPVAVVVPGAAVFAVGDSQAAADNALATFRDGLLVAADAGRLGGVRVMDARERHFIEHWEAEAYRKSVAAGQAGS